MLKFKQPPGPREAHSSSGTCHIRRAPRRHITLARKPAPQQSHQHWEGLLAPWCLQVGDPLQQRSCTLAAASGSRENNRQKWRPLHLPDLSVIALPLFLFVTVVTSGERRGTIWWRIWLNTLTSRIPKCSTIYLPEARELAHCLYESLFSTSMLGIIESVDSISKDERGFPLTQYITNGRISRGGYTFTHFKHHRRVLRLISYRMGV